MLHPILQAQLPFMVQLLKSHKVKSAYAFGSVVSDKFNEESDIDLLIDFEDGVKALERGKIWWELHDALRNVFGREVDLLVENSLKNPYFIEDINEKKQLIYAA
ncbi:nucleotidyltransferase family protein [Mucilaginibacter sp.]|uniref:nucleotidyltransferase family protein n=1 Tax=Mucilaginibacter sp. TaxID=1882438 RepID=UPI002637541F|nr:nucleotidyltransferase domain-containing protein [Mucilaginibacter sp.]MDB4927393.1 nucleotidyltransferase protein [Mucilaginibacter sp.]